MGINIDLHNRTALITGATRGIGKAIADDFIEAGARVILTGTSLSQVNQLAKSNTNTRVRWVHAEFNSNMGIDKFLDALSAFKKIDICINNAGINIIKPFDQYSQDEYARLLSVNLAAPFQLMQHLLPRMRKKNYGRIVNIASIWSQSSKPGRALYSTSKTALTGLTRTLALEYGDSNVLVNSVSPGFTMTELTKNSLSPQDIDDLKSKIPLQRIAQPTEISKLVLFLSSNLNTYITGQNILIDGGFTIA